MHGALCTQHVCSKMPAREISGSVCKWFRRNNGHLTIQIWTPCRYHIWGTMHEVFESFFQSQIQFLQCENFPQNKAVASFRKSLREYVRSSGKHPEHFALNSKMCSHLTVFGLSWTLSVRQFLISSKRQVARIKRSFVNSLRNAIKLSKFVTNWMGN